MERDAITKFVTEGSNEMTLEVQFEFYAEHPYTDNEQTSTGFGDIFAAVDYARRLQVESGRPTQVRIALFLDDQGKYIEQDCPTTETK